MFGMRIIEDANMTKRLLKAMCRSKKRRIRKKWLKSPRNYRTVPDDNVYMGRDMIICHPSIAAELRRQIREARPDRNEPPPTLWLGRAYTLGL